MRNKMILLCTTLLFSWGAIASQSVSIMTYNVENLFDWEHDEGKLDFTYLPKAVKRKDADIRAYCASQGNYFYRRECFELDWTPQTVGSKIQNIAQVILAADSNGPDILVLNEVENLNVVQLLVEQGLAGLGYQSIELIEGPDRRGIDVAVVSKFPLAQASKLHIVDLDEVSNGRGATRGILEVQLDVGGVRLAVFANHWPSMGNPNSYREQAAKALDQAVANAGTPYALAVGDFNSLDDASATGLYGITLNEENPNFFYDTHHHTYVHAEDGIEGTHFYKGEWSFLDRILVYNKAVTQGSVLISLNYQRIISPDFALRWVGEGQNQRPAPSRFDAKAGTGASDHLGLYLSFEVH